MKKHGEHGLSCLALAALATSPLAYGQADTLTVKRPTELREAPGESARSLGALAMQTPVTRLTAHQGPWIEVRTAQRATGWIHMFDVGTALPAQGGNTATGALRGLTGFFGKGQAANAYRGRTRGGCGCLRAGTEIARVVGVEPHRLDLCERRKVGLCLGDVFGTSFNHLRVSSIAEKPRTDPCD